MTSMLTRTHALTGGRRVRVRLGRRSDAAAVTALLEGAGVVATALDVRRLLTYDPTGRCVLCAFAPIDGAETLVGLGAIDLRDGAEPDALVADPELAALLGRILAERARTHGRRVA